MILYKYMVDCGAIVQAWHYDLLLLAIESILRKLSDILQAEPCRNTESGVVATSTVYI